MAEFDDTFEDEESDALDPNIRAELRKSKERLREAEAAKAEAEALKRELAFTKAGIPEEGVGALLRKAYDGEIEPEAIRSAAAEYGINVGHTEQASQSDPIREELDRARSIAGATGMNESGPTVAQEFLAAMAGAMTEEEAMEVVRKIGGEAGLFAPGSR